MNKPTLYRILSIALVLVLTAPVIARDMTREERLADFEQAVGLLRSSYGMIEYKKQTQGIDFDKAVATFRAKIRAVAKDNEFYDLMSAFIAGFKDAHLNHSRPSTMSARLGFGVNRIEGKAIITEIGPALTYDLFPFAVGDELVSLDGKPVATLVRERLPFYSNAREESLLNFVTGTLPYRSGWSGAVPTGMCKVEIRPRGATETVTLDLAWIVRGKPLPGLSFYNNSPKKYPLDPSTWRPDLFVNPLAAARATACTTPAWAPDEKKRSLPTEEFAACTFKTEKGSIGYVRIPSFMPDDATSAVEEFKKLMMSMSKTSGLIIDLTDNPGGSLYYMMAILSMLTEKPLAMPLVSDRASRRVLNGCREWAGQESNPSIRASLENHALAIEKAMEQGLEMTSPSTVFGSIVAPSQEVRYTKPIVVLINDQCYSCGDIFPAILQDNKRAVLFGTTTAGAGGSVNTYGPLAYSGSSISITETLMKRTNGTYIENVGVSPDITFEITQDDAATGYGAYRQAYIDALLKLIP